MSGRAEPRVEEEAVAEVETEAEADPERVEAETETEEAETEEADSVTEEVEMEAGGRAAEEKVAAERGHRLQISLEHEDGTRSSRRMPFLCIDDTRRQESCIRLLTCLLLPIQTCRRRQGA